MPWQLRIGKDGSKKKVAIGGYFCPNLAYEYKGICDEVFHALVEYGGHGVHEEICGFKCQACGKKLPRGRTR